MELLGSNKLLVVIIVFAGVIVLSSAFITKQQQSDEWIVPEEYKKMKNPTVPNEKDLKFGKSLYLKHCKACHGADGKGGFPNAGDFTTKAFQSQTDGELFYKTLAGRDKMPGYEKSIPDNEDRWILVNYLKTFKTVQ